MKIRELIGTAKAPGGVELRLLKHDADYVIMLDSYELMNSRMGGSEEALAVMTCERLGKAPGCQAPPHLLVGGYGMGFTLRAALGVLGPGARLTVAEIVPEIVDWARGPMAAMTAGCLDDPRVRLLAGDVAAEIGAGSGRYDAILLDVDNGPSGLVRAANDRLYTLGGLGKAKAALKPGGILAIWSAAPDEASSTTK
jgi:spermidine synthase